MTNLPLFRASWIQHTLSHSTHKFHYNITLLHNAHAYQVVCVFQFSPSKFCTDFTSPPCTPHALSMRSLNSDTVQGRLFCKPIQLTYTVFLKFYTGPRVTVVHYTTYTVLGLVERFGTWPSTVFIQANALTTRSPGRKMAILTLHALHIGHSWASAYPRRMQFARRLGWLATCSVVPRMLPTTVSQGPWC
jgi:hypothetical protein